MDSWQMVVKENDIWLKLLCLAQGLTGIGGITHEPQLRVTRQERGQAAPEKRMVIHDENSNGIPFGLLICCIHWLILIASASVRTGPG